MTLPEFTWTTRARPIVEMGLGDTRIPVGQATWDAARWDDNLARWSGDEPTWYDITCDVREWRCEYGRARSIDRFVPGSAQVVVDNATGWADPSAAVAPGVLTMRPGRSIRLGVVHAEYGVRWIFRGFVDAITPTYDPTYNDTVVLDCLDALGEVNRAKVIPVTPAYAGDTVDERIVRVLDLAKWPTSKRAIDPASDRLIAHHLGGQVADLLGQAAESNGGSIYGDNEGDVVYRGRDWQMFVPGTPPDGTIGNVEPGHIIPGTPQVDGYLTPTVGTVSTPDPGPVAAQSVWVFKVSGTTGTLASQWTATAGEAGYIVRRDPANGVIWYTYAPTGSSASATSKYALMGPTTTWYAIAADQTTGTMRSWHSVDGAVWTALAPQSFPPFTVFDATSSLRIGAYPGGVTWGGRVYSAECRTGLDPAAGTVLWRFDANDYPGTGTTYIDPRGRTWTLTNSTAITPKVPAVAPVVVPPDVCPTQWDRPFTRRDMATRVIIGRDEQTAVQLDDTDAQIRYGIEPFERTDLLTESDDTITLLAERVLRTRRADAAPRIRSVSLDARTSDEALDLMTTVDVYRPSRYRCRLELERGLVFDDEHFATGVVHEVTPSMWTLELNLDLAEPYEAGAARWDDNLGWDRTTWTTVGV